MKFLLMSLLILPLLGNSQENSWSVKVNFNKKTDLQEIQNLCKKFNSKFADRIVYYVDKIQSNSFELQSLYIFEKLGGIHDPLVSFFTPTTVAVDYHISKNGPRIDIINCVSK